MSLQTVLIEDSSTIREALVPALADLVNAEVVAVAETAREGIEILQKLGDSWDLAVVDLFLREGSGLAVLRTCKQRAPHQRMVVLTNYPTEEMRRRSLELGADALFDKSTQLDQFFEWCLRSGLPRSVDADALWKAARNKNIKNDQN
ncbi:response regulator [Variovorax paradoxus]|jgi:DNA-binding NarL/FixJ family response regulator|uniref:response regulator n=1 Tax=Variovorax paradoxus TaxID=34073 RepID=UPI002480BB38|nr:response regulator transcription factor [Variovorax paradoxus]WGT65607.1 response regulator transcription factor [Variovorax paradoxus]